MKQALPESLPWELGGSGGFGRELGDKGSDCRVDGLKGTHFSSDHP